MKFSDNSKNNTLVADSGKILKQVDVQIKEINTILTRLIPENDAHTILKENTKTKLQLIPNNKLTYRIPCKGKPSPCKISIRYLDGKKANHHDLQVFVSKTEISPSTLKCD